MISVSKFPERFVNQRWSILVLCLAKFNDGLTWSNHKSDRWHAQIVDRLRFLQLPSKSAESWFAHELLLPLHHITHMINFTRLFFLCVQHWEHKGAWGRGYQVKRSRKEVCVHAKIFKAFTLAWTYLTTFILGYQLTLCLLLSIEVRWLWHSAYSLTMVETVAKLCFGIYYCDQVLLYTNLSYHIIFSKQTKSWLSCLRSKQIKDKN